MTGKRDGFTIHDLEELSGFDRRTIAFYIQEGLLPKVGRRGRSTVYPSAFMEKLMLIRAIRNLQDAGTLRAVTLAEVQDAMKNLDTDELPALRAEGADAIRALFRDPDWDTSAIDIPVETVVHQLASKPSKTPQANNTNVTEKKSSTPLTKQNSSDVSGMSIVDLLQLIDSAAETNLENNESPNPEAVQSISIKLSEHVKVTVDNLSSDDTHLLVQLVHKLIKHS